MGKPGIAKKKKGPSIHSRAARRATSPSIDTDKSLKELNPPALARTESRPSVLAAHHGAGVTKKSSKRKAILSSRARRRQEKGADRAEVISERVAAKIEKRVKSGKSIRSRGKTWDEVNGTGVAKTKRKGQSAPKEDLWGTDDEAMGVEEEPLKAKVPLQALEAAAEDEEDEIL